MHHNGNEGEQEKQVNQATGNVKEQETTCPQYEQQNGQTQKWSESHNVDLHGLVLEAVVLLFLQRKETQRRGPTLR